MFQRTGISVRHKAHINALRIDRSQQINEEKACSKDEI